MPGYASTYFLRNASVRTGVYVAVCLSTAFNVWVIVANRVTFLERFAMVRNLAAVAVLCVLALIPVLRFWRMPGNLLASGLVTWVLFSVDYRLMCLYFGRLGERYGAVQIFMLGAVAYLLLVTIAWIATIIRRARASDASHPNHRVS